MNGFILIETVSFTYILQLLFCFQRVIPGSRKRVILPLGASLTCILPLFCFSFFFNVSFQDQGNVFLLSLGTIHNCLRHPDVIPIVKQMDIVHHITPFLWKKSKDQSKDYFPHLQSTDPPAASPMHLPLIAFIFWSQWTSPKNSHVGSQVGSRNRNEIT